jgi:hypothetical protein
VQIHGITGNMMETKGKVDLCIGETSPHEFMLVGDLPMKCDILLGQDWLERFGYQFRIPDLSINLPTYSETLVRIPTTEKGSRLLETEELQENTFCASSVVECVINSFICLVINCNTTDKLLRKFPRTQELPKLSGKFLNAKGKELHARNQVLQAQLRLAHVKEGEQELQKEVDTQIQQMLEDKFMQPRKSPWNFPILIVPRKWTRKEYRICVDFRKLNDLTVGDSYLLQNIQNFLDKLSRDRY